MSWLKLNDSLSALKGQISNFAQEVLAEADDDTEASRATTVSVEEDSTKSLEEASVRIDELSNLCSIQDNEVGSFFYIDTLLVFYLCAMLFLIKS